MIHRAALTLLLLTLCAGAHAQTGFVYKGSLIVGGVKVTGKYDFAFSLWDAPNGGAQQALINKNGVQVNTGVYSVTLDFGVKTFSGAPLYLNIQYRKTGTATWSTIAGRQQLSVRFSIVSQSTTALQGRPVNPIMPLSGQVLKWNGANWAPASDLNAIYKAGAGLALSAGTFSIAPLGVSNAMLAANAVTTAKIAAGAVTPAKLSWPFVYSGPDGGFLFSVTNTGAGTGVFGKGGYAGVSGGSTNGTGVVGYSTNSFGLFGESAYDVGVYGYSQGKYGVQGESEAGTGVVGVSVAGTAISGSSEAGTGVSGTSVGGDAVSGTTVDGIGVSGVSENDVGVFGKSGEEAGVYGQSARDSGVLGYSSYAWGVQGVSLNSYAGYFNGDLFALRASASIKEFEIDHPLDPVNKYLAHSCVESDERANLYRGNSILDSGGQAWVKLPDWFESLNRDFNYQLTAVGAPGPGLYVAQEIAENRFLIAGGAPGMKVSWQVTGVRQDAVARANPMQVERLKPEGERGTLLNPAAYGQPEAMAPKRRNPAKPVRAGKAG